MHVIRTTLCGLGLLAILVVPVPAEPFTARFATKPEHAILIIIDGLSYKVWDRMDLPILKKMIAGGALVEKNYLPPAADPRKGAYAELHSCSIPNPIMMAGTVFINRETGYLQDSFKGRPTAFVANCMAYVTLNLGYTYSYQQGGPDDDSIRMALEFMKMGKPAFMRVHLQSAGGKGAASMDCKGDEAWKANIWAPDSPYRQAILHADNLLGRLISGLEEQGMLNSTVFVIMGDHGQDDGGWHPLEMPDPSITSIVLWGAGVKRGARIPYSEQVDVVPTVCALMNVAPPKTCQGRVIAEALAGYQGQATPRQTLIKELDEQLIGYRKKMAEAFWLVEGLKSPRQGAFFSELNKVRQSFFDIHRFVEWPQFKTMDELLANNRKAMAELEPLLLEIRKNK